MRANASRMNKLAVRVRRRNVKRDKIDASCNDIQAQGESQWSYTIQRELPEDVDCQDSISVCSSLN